MLFGLLMLLVAAHVGSALPPIQGWDFPVWLTVGTIAADFVLVTVRKPGRLARWQVTTMVGFSFAAAMLLVVPGDGGTSYRAIPYALGYLNLSLSLLVLRGHTVVGTLSALTILSGLALWGVRAGLNPTAQAEYLGQPTVTLVGFWMIFLVSRSIANSRVRTVAQQLSAVAETDAARGILADERRALSEIPDRVEPLLRRIASGEPLTEGFRAELIAADEEVRNLLRHDLPDHQGLLGAIAKRPCARRHRPGDRQRGPFRGSAPRGSRRPVDRAARHRRPDQCNSPLPAALARRSRLAAAGGRGLGPALRVRLQRRTPPRAGLTQ